MADQLTEATRIPGLDLTLWTNTQWETAYLGLDPFATVQRKRILDSSDAPQWQAYGLDGVRFAHAGTARTLVRLVEARAAWCAALSLRNVTIG